YRPLFSSLISLFFLILSCLCACLFPYTSLFRSGRGPAAPGPRVRSFPTRRSSDLGAGLLRLALAFVASVLLARALGPDGYGVHAVLGASVSVVAALTLAPSTAYTDRKSTRLNSSH